MPAGTSEGSSKVTQVLKMFSGNGENDSMDMREETSFDSNLSYWIFPSKNE
jgi:hypothetical protein